VGQWGHRIGVPRPAPRPGIPRHGFDWDVGQGGTTRPGHPKTSRSLSRDTSGQTARASKNRTGFAAFRAFCRGLVLDNGKPFVLEPFQARILGDYFRGIPQTVIVIPKGNGKTTLLAGLALYHLLNTLDAEVIICAASRDQASILLDQARGLVIRSDIAEKLYVHQREIRRRDNRGRIRVLASDVDKIDGLIFTLGLIDELHRHNKSELSVGPRLGRAFPPRGHP
jgi:phage terminase large subunit-like protein